jgi:hypothetical protein
MAGREQNDSGSRGHDALLRLVAGAVTAQLSIRSDGGLRAVTRVDRARPS